MNSKGGVGKSTIAVHLAVWLKEEGVNVAVVDADVQGSSTRWLKRVEPDLPVYRWRKPEEIVRGVEMLKGKVDAIVFDGPGGLDKSTKTLMAICDGILVPCGPSILDLEALQDSLSVVAEIQAERGGLPVVRLVPNKIQKRYRLSQQLLNVIEESDVMGSTGLGLRQPFAEAAEIGTVVWRMGSSGREATREIRRLFEETLNDSSTFEEEDYEKENSVRGGQPVIAEHH